MPFRIDGSPTPATATISASGAVRTEAQLTSGVSEIVPLLICAGEINDLRLNDVSIAISPPLRPLASHQQLVAVAGSGDRLANRLFPGESIVTIHVDPLDPLPGAPLAWQTLDALIIDRPWPGALDPHKIPMLLAGGTQIAVVSQDRPDDFWPWESIDGGWVLRPQIAGPIGCDGTDAAYAPAGAWRPDLHGSVRLQVVLAGILFSIAALGCLLLPQRGRVPAIAMAGTLSIVAIGVWRDQLPVVFRARGGVIIDGAALTQIDQWQYATARQSAEAAFDCVGEAWPIFADGQQAQRLNILLHWREGNGRFTFDLKSDATLALVSRILRPPIVAAAQLRPEGIETPMASLARALYVHGRVRLTTESAARWDDSDAVPSWPTVHLRPDY